MENSETPSKKTSIKLLPFIVIVGVISILLVNYLQKGKNNSTQKAVDATPIRIAYPALGTVVSGQVGNILQKTDILKNNGLLATITPMNTGKEMKVALVGNQVDVILTSESNFVVLLGQGFPCYAIASLGSDGKMGLTVNPDSTIKTVADLKNKKIGTLFGTSVHRPAVQWAKDAGLIPGKDVEIVNFGGADALRTALAAKQIDAIVTWDPYLADGINKNIHREIISADLDLVVVMSKDYADKNPDAVSKLREALKESAFYMSQNKTQVNTWYGEMSKLDVGLLHQSSASNRNYNATKLADIDVSISASLIEKFVYQAEFLFAEKLIQQKPEIGPYIQQ